ARDVQVYLLKLGSGRIKTPTHERAANARDAYLAGIEQALAHDRAFLSGDALPLADAVFATELALFSGERAHAKRMAEASLEPLWSDALRNHWPRALAHFARLCAHPAFAPDLGPYLAKLAVR